MKNTGSVYNTVLGEIDDSSWIFEKGNVSTGGSYFPIYDKVVPYTTELVKRLDDKLSKVHGQEEQLKLSFAAHFDLVSIHPFYDGNGRTSRLLMNFKKRERQWIFCTTAIDACWHEQVQRVFSNPVTYIQVPFLAVNKIHF